MKAWGIIFSGVRISHHLPRVVDAKSYASVATQVAKVPHVHSIRSGDEERGMLPVPPLWKIATTCPALLMSLA